MFNSKDVHGGELEVSVYSGHVHLQMFSCEELLVELYYKPAEVIKLAGHLLQAAKEVIDANNQG